MVCIVPDRTYVRTIQYRGTPGTVGTYCTVSLIAFTRPAQENLLGAFSWAGREICADKPGSKLGHLVGQKEFDKPICSCSAFMLIWCLQDNPPYNVSGKNGFVLQFLIIFKNGFQLLRNDNYSKNNYVVTSLLLVYLNHLLLSFLVVLAVVLVAVPLMDVHRRTLCQRAGTLAYIRLECYGRTLLARHSTTLNGWSY